MKKFFTNNWHSISVSFFIALFFALSLGSSLRESLTFDEIVYLQEGRQILLQHTFSIDPYNPPFVKEFAVLPYLFTKNFYTNPLFHMHFPLGAKLTTVLLGAGVLFMTYGLARKYIGGIEAVFAVGLLSTEPTFLANSHIVTLDIGLTFFFLASYGLFLSLFKKTTISSKIVFTIGIGLGLATKLSFIPFFLTSALAATFYSYGKMAGAIIWKKKKSLTVIFLLSLFIVWFVYWFRLSPVIKIRHDNARVSQKILTFSSTHHMPFLGQMILFSEKQGIPLGDFLAINKNTVLRPVVGKCFFLGSYYSSCLPYFLPINLFLKLPLPLLIFVGVSFLLFIRNKDFQRKAGIFVIPLVTIIGIGSLSRMQPLVRYVLPAYPFLILFAASGLYFWQRRIGLKILFAGLCFWYITSAFITYPRFLSYANEFAGYPEQRFSVLTDSNLDWGQSLPEISDFIKEKKPSIIFLSYFGRDNGDWYGLSSDKAYMSYKNPEICTFHAIRFHQERALTYTLISSSNWYSCGYYKEKKFAKQKIKGILGDTILIF